MNDKIKEKVGYKLHSNGWAKGDEIPFIAAKTMMIDVGHFRDDEVLALTSRVAVAEGANDDLKAENKKQQEVIYLYALDIQEYKAKQKKYSDLLHRLLSECGDDLSGRACSLISEVLKDDE